MPAKKIRVCILCQDPIINRVKNAVYCKDCRVYLKSALDAYYSRERVMRRRLLKNG